MAKKITLVLSGLFKKLHGRWKNKIDYFVFYDCIFSLSVIYLHLLLRIATKVELTIVPVEEQSLKSQSIIISRFKAGFNGYKSYKAKTALTVLSCIEI